MFQINTAFFLIGALIFLIIKFAIEVKLWGQDPLKKVPKRWAGTVFWLWMGSLFLFCALNTVAVIIQIAITSTAPAHGIIYLIPLILFIIHTIEFIIPSLIKPTKNFLLGILICSIIIVFIIIVYNIIFPYSFLDIFLGILPLPVALAIPVGWFSTLIFYVFLKKFIKKYNEDLWDISESNIVQLFRNDWFKLALIIITFITAWIYIPL